MWHRVIATTMQPGLSDNSSCDIDQSLIIASDKFLKVNESNAFSVLTNGSQAPLQEPSDYCEAGNSAAEIGDSSESSQENANLPKILHGENVRRVLP